MKTLALILVALAAQACVLNIYTNVEIDAELAREYEIVDLVTAQPHALSGGKIQLHYVSWDQLLGMWHQEGLAVGLTSTDPEPHRHVIYITPPPADHCKVDAALNRAIEMADPSKTGKPWAKVAIHELLHAAHFHHGDEMDQAEEEAWEIYKERHCK